MAASSSPRVGFIGLGDQGGPIAERIAGAGFPLTVWARRPEALAPFVARGALAAASPAELAAGCDLLAVCVRDDAGVAEVAEATLPTLRPGALLVIHSTMLPQGCEALATQAAAAGVLFLDAPVSGGEQAAREGRLTLMCGGEAGALDRARPVLESFAGAIFHLGPAGAGQRAKIVNNALMTAHMGLAHAAFAAAGALGIEPGAFGELVKRSSGRSFGFELYAQRRRLGDFGHGPPLLAKDVDLLAATLPGEKGAEALRAAAEPFLRMAVGARVSGR